MQGNLRRIQRMAEEDVALRELVDDGGIVAFTPEVREPPINDRVVLLFFAGRGPCVRRHLGAIMSPGASSSVERSVGSRRRCYDRPSSAQTAEAKSRSMSLRTLDVATAGTALMAP